LSKNLKALIVDNDDLARHTIATVFNKGGWSVHETKFPQDILQLVAADNWNVVIFEFLPDLGYGFELLNAFTQDRSATKVVLTTSQVSAVAAFHATRLNAFDYIRKPIDVSYMSLLFDRLNGVCKASLETARTAPNVSHNSEHAVVGSSDALIEVMKQVGRIARTSLPVLLTGESGTGKEVVASLLHSGSSRSGGPFVAVNCSAIPAELIESELFGHDKGAFTGADRDRLGLWEEAAGGTILLDEVTETSLSFQVKLLRIIQSGEVRRVGSNQTRHLDVRVLAASNRNVEDEVEAGRFRRDLFHRINAISIRLPPLRERKEDIPLLIDAFERSISSKSRLQFSTEVLDIFHHYAWPGNVRELEHVVQRCVAMCEGIVLPQDLPEGVRKQQELSPEAAELKVADAETETWPELTVVEGAYVARVLEHTNWNKQAAARVLNVDRKTLDRMIKRNKIIRSSKDKADRDYRAA
jgi:DNA-binding NtrC family response regulator